MNRGDGSHGWPLGRAQARAMVIRLRCRLLLRNRKDVGNLFYLPRGSGGLRRGLATMASFPRTWVMARVSYGGSPTMMKTPTGAVVLVEAPGAVGLARAAMNRCSSEQDRALFSCWGNVVVGATGGFF
jgi:hypothetical protein